MNLQELNNKKNEAIITIENQLLKLIDIKTNEVRPTIKYKNIDNKNFFIFSTVIGLPNQYSLFYNVEADEFSLEGKNYDDSNCYFDDGVDILKIHQQLCNKKQDMLKIINQDF